MSLINALQIYIFMEPSLQAKRIGGWMKRRYKTWILTKMYCMGFSTFRGDGSGQGMGLLYKNSLFSPCDSEDLQSIVYMTTRQNFAMPFGHCVQNEFLKPPLQSSSCPRYMYAFSLHAEPTQWRTAVVTPAPGLFVFPLLPPQHVCFYELDQVEH